MRNVPVLTGDPARRQPAWQQVADTIRDAISSGMLVAGDPLPSVREMSELQDVPVATLQHALAVLADEGLVIVHQGRYPASVPEDVAKVIPEGRKTHPVLTLYLWLVAITGAGG